MSLKQLAIGVAIALWALAQLTTTVTYRAFLWVVLVVGILWVLEQLLPRATTVSRPARKTEV